MIQRKKRIVMFLPHRADPDTGVRVSADLLPLELLQIAVFPEREGYECHIVDAMVHDDYLEQMPISRVGTVDDIAAAVRYLAGPESSWVTGQTLGVDGGHQLRRGPNYHLMFEQA